MAMARDRKHRLAIVQYGRMLHESGFVAATDGNLSVRLDDKRLLVTPTCISKGRMRSSDMVIVDMEGKRLAGKRRVSSEIGMHLLIYRLRPRCAWHRPCPSPDRHRICRIWTRSESPARVRGRRRPGLDSAGALRHSRHSRTHRRSRASHSAPRSHPDGEPRSGHIRFLARKCVHENGDRRALRQDRLGHSPARQRAATRANWRFRNCTKCAHRYKRGAASIPPRRPASSADLNSPDLNSDDLESNDDPRQTAGSRQ
jgi:hypothetical protein